jgi:hypothetical protein
MIRDLELPTKVKLQFHFVRNLSSDCLNRRHDLENVHLSMKGTKRNEKEKKPTKQKNKREPPKRNKQKHKRKIKRKRSQQNRRTKENHHYEIKRKRKEINRKEKNTKNKTK